MFCNDIQCLRNQRNIENPGIMNICPIYIYILNVCIIYHVVICVCVCGEGGGGGGGGGVFVVLITVIPTMAGTVAKNWRLGHRNRRSELKRISLTSLHSLWVYDKYLFDLEMCKCLYLPAITAANAISVCVVANQPEFCANVNEE